MAVVAVDLDGVLRVPRAAPTDKAPPETLEVEITMRRDAYPSYSHTEPPWDEHDEWTATHTFSKAGVNWVEDLLRREIDVVWATRWQLYANFYFAAALGLPRLPVAVGFEYKSYDEWPSIAARQLSRQFNGRPLLWVSPLVSDARPYLDERRTLADRALTRSYLIPTPRQGITTADAANMDDWLEMAATTDGRNDLRIRRSRTVQRRRRDRLLDRWGTEARYDRWRRAYNRLGLLLSADEEALRLLIADHALEEPRGVDPARVAELRDEWGISTTPPVASILAMVNRGELLRPASDACSR